MIQSYLIIAFRHILKNKTYAAINILGLVVGLVTYLFGSLLIDYENNHDKFYKNSDRIYTAGSIFSASANIGVGQSDGIYTAAGPLLLNDSPDIEAIARTVRFEYLVSIEDNNYYQDIRFVDPSLLDIFDFQYIQGDESALQNPTGLLLTRTTAEKYFGDTEVLGRVVIVDHNISLSVTAVIEDLPPNTHFNSALIGSSSLHVLAPLQALNHLQGYDIAGNWNNLSSGDHTYILMPQARSIDSLQAQLDAIYDKHFPETAMEFITGFRARPLADANTLLWDAIGMPVLQSVELLALLILIVSIVNYTNLATAQSLGRAKEVGLRKTFGASRANLLAQFLIESLCITTVSMLIALAMLEIVVPYFNNISGKALVLDYLTVYPWLVTTTLVVGLVAGAYPAYLITKSSPIEALRAGSSKGGLFRSVMLGLQFSISIFMLAMVLVIYFQNDKIDSASQIYPRSQIVTLKKLDIKSVQQRLATLRNEMLTIDGVENVSFSSHVPYQTSTFGRNVTPTLGDENARFTAHQITIDDRFIDTYDIEMVTGRNLSSEINGDEFLVDSSAANVMVNELAARKLGYVSSSAAIDQVFYDFTREGEATAFRIVGILPDQNFRGFFNEISATMFVMRPLDTNVSRGSTIMYASIRVKTQDMRPVIVAIEAVWDDLIPDYPAQIEFLDETFERFFNIFGYFTKTLGGFATIAFALSIIGLYGLAAFMAENRTKEIGIRKVMGASIVQLVGLMIFQFSKPVMWALLIALPAAYYASSIYLDFFADRLSMPSLIVLVAGILAVSFAWLIVAIHAVNIARCNPIQALRYE